MLGQDYIRAANCTTQQNIQIVIHRIFELLVEALKTHGADDRTTPPSESGETWSKDHLHVRVPWCPPFCVLLVVLLLSAESRKRLFLLTMFGMSQKYQVADLSLAVSCGLLPLLRDQCGGAEQLCKVMSMVVYSKHDADGGDTLLQLACFRLWQIIAVSLG